MGENLEILPDLSTYKTTKNVLKSITYSLIPLYR